MNEVKAIRKDKANNRAARKTKKENSKVQKEV